MPCCGGKRARSVAVPTVTRVQPSRPVAPAVSAQPVTFEYIGNTALTVTGPMTRATYRFRAPGARVPVDARDARAVAALPHVRRVEGHLN
jgi:hypothetical protein